MEGFCKHLSETHDVQPSAPVCMDCLQAGTRWFGLTICLSCGYVGCWDSSPGKHARTHFNQTQHPVVQSFEPGEDWQWCFVDEIQVEHSPKHYEHAERKPAA